MGRARAFLVASALLGTLLASTRASAQQPTFHLDRLEIAGAPDDGIVLFRPVTKPKPTVFGQLGIGYTKNPLHTSNITHDSATLSQSETGVVSHQLTTYATVGVQLLNRLTLAATLPVTFFQDGQNPNYSIGVFTSAQATRITADGAHLNDMRLDGRLTLLKSADEKTALAGHVALFAPTGSTTNFGGDGVASGWLMIEAEKDFDWLVLTLNTGVHFRTTNSINFPQNDNGLGIGNEWRWAVGGFLPFKGGKFRLGATVFGQTGIESDKTLLGDTFFKKRNTPVEWNVEARYKFGPDDKLWLGFGGGTLIGNGYGAPDLRLVGLFGAYTTIFDVDAKAPDQRKAMREKWRSERTSKDSDNDGIPDDIDACPTEPEDHEGNDPNDGCPMPPDRDGDGIPDNIDKCPDQPEDKDGIEDGDGCPEDDFDKDGVPDATDACPREPGQPAPDPKKNGCPQFIKLTSSGVQVLQQVHFATGSTTILPDSFPMLQEIANLLKANQGIKKMSIEGHTDDRGDDNMNLKLSQGRADSVRTWLTQHGVDAGRLEAHGYGEQQPIEDNKTDKGRAANRRVEFKITEEDDANKPH